MSIVNEIKRYNGYSKLSDEDILKAIRYFQFFEYISKEFSLDEFESAIVRLQKQADLAVSGDLTPKTLRVLDVPRCGCPEHMEEANQLNKWGLDVVTFYISGRDSDLSSKLWDEAVIRAFEGVEKVCGLQFRQVLSSEEANIIIGVGRGRASQFDGPSGVLGWSELPTGPNFRGQIQAKLDTDENWVYPEGRGIYLLNVMAHEVGGHGVGLSHTDSPNNLMNPFYSQQIATPQPSWDIPQLVKRYGLPKPTNTPTPTPTPTPNDPTEMIIKLRGSIEIPGYRVSKIG